MSKPGVQVEVDGATALRASLARAGDDLEEMATAELRAGQIIKQRASALAPKVSGSLAQSITASTGGTGVTIGSDLVYAPVQEYGWRGHNINPQPFLRPAAAETDQWMPAYEDEAQAILHKVKGA